MECPNVGRSYWSLRTNGAHDDAYKLELTGDDSVAWSAVTLGGPAGSKGIPARAQHAACVTADMKHMFVFGGYNGEKVTNDLWHFEQVTSQYQPQAVYVGVQLTVLVQQ